MKSQLLICCTLSAMLFMASCGEKSKPAEAKASDIIPVKTIPIVNSNSDGYMMLSGQFTTDDDVFLGFKTGGVISSILVKEGDPIRKGQVLATLNLTEINAGVQQATLGVDKAKRDYQRVQNLFNDSVATQEQMQNAKTALDIATEQLASARFNLGFSEIRAPKDGYVLRKMAGEGQVIGSGMPVLQTNGAQSGNWMLKVGASDKEWATLRVNDHAEISSGTNATTKYEGIVSKKSPSIDPYTGLFTIDIRISSGDKKGIATGMFGKATIKTGPEKAVTKVNQWLIPYDALLDADGKTGYVFITNDGTSASKIKVTIGAIEKDKVLITGGLENVQQLIVSGSAYLTDKSPIKIGNVN